jgi:hypothetical protein
MMLLRSQLHDWTRRWGGGSRRFPPLPASSSLPSSTHRRPSGRGWRQVAQPVLLALQLPRELLVRLQAHLEPAPPPPCAQREGSGVELREVVRGVVAGPLTGGVVSGHTL